MRSDQSLKIFESLYIVDYFATNIEFQKLRNHNVTIYDPLFINCFFSIVILPSLPPLLFFRALFSKARIVSRRKRRCDSAI